MTKRFRMVAGPNGSGKSTLVGLLRRDYAVNFYTMLNADDILAEVSRTHAFQPQLPIAAESLLRYVEASGYAEALKDFFRRGDVQVCDDTVHFGTDESVNSYTVALLTNFLQSEYIAAGKSFSQETVFSHPSKIEALERALNAGFRTYLYFVATGDVAINLGRIANRVERGGHSVPADKVLARAVRSLENVSAALPFCSRAFFFDNSALEMRFIAEYSRNGGFASIAASAPLWFEKYILAKLLAGRAEVEKGSGNRFCRLCCKKWNGGM